MSFWGSEPRWGCWGALTEGDGDKVALEDAPVSMSRTKAGLSPVDLRLARWLTFPLELDIVAAGGTP